MAFLRKQLGLILRVLFSGVVLYFLFTNKQMDWAAFLRDVRNADPVWLAPGFVIMGIVTVLGTYRWKLLLHLQEIDLSFVRLLQLNMVGQFFNAFLLGVTGGDFVKIFYIAHEVPERRSAAGLSIVYDRILGLFGIMIWGVAFTCFNYTIFNSTPEAHIGTWTFLLIFCGAIGGMSFAYAIPWLRRQSGLWKLEQKLPFHQTLENLSEALQKYARRPVDNLYVLAISVLIHAGLFLVMYSVSKAIGMHVSFWQLAAVVSIINVLIAIPISVSGLGFREKLFIIFLALFGIPHSQAFAFSLIGFGLNLMLSVIGGLFYLKYKKPGEKVSEVAMATQ